MNRSIKTYQDLLQEEQRLTAQLASYKGLIKEDLTALKASLNPIRKVKESFKKLFTRDPHNPVLNFGLNFGIDLLLRRLLLARAGGALKFLVPFVTKNYLSHIISEENKNKVAKSIINF